MLIIINNITNSTPIFHEECTSNYYYNYILVNDFPTSPWVSNPGTNLVDVVDDELAILGARGQHLPVRRETAEPHLVQVVGQDLCRVTRKVVPGELSWLSVSTCGNATSGNYTINIIMMLIIIHY